ncbi:MAG: hypothetical protein IKG61_01285 [Selenomonadaceae bacterium]|nr:hypothetical protein [Selenomonadaceae bacterium]
MRQRRVQYNFKIPCWNCGRQFTPHTATDLYCSRLCRKEARKQRQFNHRNRHDGRRQPI